jgi:hypothetical protein
MPNVMEPRGNAYIMIAEVKSNHNICSLFGFVSNFEPKFKIIPNRTISQVKLWRASATSEN